MYKWSSARHHFSFIKQEIIISKELCYLEFIQPAFDISPVMFDVKFLMLPRLPLIFVEASATLRPVIFAAFFKLAKMFLIFPPEQPAMISFVNNWGIWQHFDSFYKVLID